MDRGIRHRLPDVSRTCIIIGALFASSCLIRARNSVAAQVLLRKLQEGVLRINSRGSSEKKRAPIRRLTYPHVCVTADVFHVSRRTKNPISLTDIDSSGKVPDYSRLTKFPKNFHSFRLVNTLLHVFQFQWLCPFALYLLLSVDKSLPQACLQAKHQFLIKEKEKICSHIRELSLKSMKEFWLICVFGWYKVQANGNSLKWCN